MDTPDAIARFVDSVSRDVVNSQQTAREVQNPNFLVESIP